MTGESAVHRTELDQPILAAVDGSASSYQAAAWAAVEAALHRRPLHILTSVAIPTGFGPGALLTEDDTESLRRSGERIVTEATSVARTAAPGADLAITTEVTFELIPATLIERSAHARMLVVGSRGVGAFQRGLLGSVSTAVTHHAHCPVAVIHGMSAIDAVSAMRPVLVGVEGSANSVPAVEIAFEEASRRKVDLIALHAWSDTSGIDLPVAGRDAAHDIAEALLSESLAGFGERYPDVAVHRITVADRPVRALLDQSGTAQLVVVGSHGRGGFSSMLLGSTSNSLLHSVEVPMIVVRLH
ncbi:universal stress protein [Nocardia sp. NBC_00565]|uniref:universal stress protein n=1 Tax=Nocardia sp. NBC_00565 TaxID=2975993 RepID=UPI002E8012F9|nr:universal stress protein [Nocardia sp. NBC_00565]WUC06448.1 universal stress protein [Nocardia sp. NBC_00565]